MSQSLMIWPRREDRPWVGMCPHVYYSSLLTDRLFFLNTTLGKGRSDDAASIVASSSTQVATISRVPPAVCPKRLSWLYLRFRLRHVDAHTPICLRSVSQLYFQDNGRLLDWIYHKSLVAKNGSRSEDLQGARFGVLLVARRYFCSDG
jgi:hypothetical protein